MRSLWRRPLALATIGILALTPALSPVGPGVQTAEASTECAPAESIVGTDVVLSFTTVGPCDWTPPAGVTTVDYLLVGGGGGGGGSRAYASGGGGGGRVVTNTVETMSSSVTIVVGAGGAGGVVTDGRTGGKAGSPTSIKVGEATAVVAEGGGGGSGGYKTTGTDTGSRGDDGFNGGGGAAQILVVAHGGNGTLGKSGGEAIGHPTNSSLQRGGGGGGSDLPGANGADGGLGGDGVSSSITGQEAFFGGGGGGGSRGTSLNSTGGAGGGAMGGTLGQEPQAGLVNTGGGGGGVGSSSGAGKPGGAGGSGVVVVRFESPVKTLTLDNEGSTTTQSVNVGNTPSDPSGSTSRSGYTLAGWSDDDDSSAEYAADLSDFTMGSSNDTLFAVWTANDNLVTFKSNYSGGPADSTQTIVTDQSTALGTNPFTRAGYTFAGWDTASNGSGTDYSDGQSVTLQAGLTLYAQWAADTYTITYSKGSVAGATGADQTGTKTHGTTLALPNSATANDYFTKTGYSVTAWSTNADGSTSDYSLGGSYATDSADTLYPVWTPNTYTVTYDYKSATGGNTTVSSDYTVDSIVIALPAPSKTGYTFGGWYSDDNTFANSVGAGGASYTPSADITVYAKWDAATFSVVYEYNGATGGNTTEDDEFTTGGTAITLPAPIRDGYTFDGWYSNASLTSSVGAAGASYSPTLNRTLYAKWTAVPRSVTYNNPESLTGSVPTDSSSYIIGDTVVVKLNSGGLVKTGYSFLGWTENSDGSGPLLQPGTTLTVSTADIDLYPKWETETYTIAYNKNGGSGDLSSAPTVWETGTPNVTLPSSGLTKTGYTFDGWQELGSTTKESFSYFPNYADTTLVARWAIKNINYTFDEGAASGPITGWPSDSSANFGSELTLPNLSGTTVTIGGDNYVFVAWESGGTTFNSGDKYVLGETSPTFTAQWAQLFDVRYTYGGGTHSVAGNGASECDTDGLCVNGESVTLRSAPERDGYTFTGWFDQSGTRFLANDTVTISATSYLFYAQWQAITYRFTFNSLGGSANPAQDKTIGQLVSMPSPGTKTGYTFGGWSADGGTTTYIDGSSYVVGTEALSFSAQWIPDVYMVTYDWQGGASSSPDVSDTYTVGTGDMSLATASGSGYSRDGYTFSGWSTSVGGSVVSGFRPTVDDVLYAVWADGNYTLSYDGQGGTVASGIGTVPRTTSVTLPIPVRSNFTFVGWYDASSGGNLLGAGGASFTPTSSQSLYARWVQDSLYGVDLATLETANTYTASSSTGIDTTISHVPSSSTARVQIPAGALPDGTVVTVRYFKDTNRQSDLISDENNYFFALLVSWVLGTGSSATVPYTAAGKPITVTLTNSSIKAGALVYQVIGETVTELGRATVDGSIEVELTEDPEIVVAATRPSTSTSVTGTSGDTRVSVSWMAGSSGGSPITGYTVTASPGGAQCSTASTTCTINSLTNNTAYTFSVTAFNALGASTASVASTAVTPVGANYGVAFNPNGGSAVADGSFFSGSTVSAPSSPSRSGYIFEGWSTTLDDESTQVTFPYAPGVTQNITLYALWEVAPVVPSRGNSGQVITPPVRPILPVTPERPQVNVPVVTAPPVLQAPVVLPTAPSVLDGSSQAIVGGQSVVTETTQRGNSGVGVKAGNVEVGLGVKNPSPNSRVQSNPANGNPELVVAAGEVVTVTGNGLLPGSTVQFWLPGAGSGELGRVTVRPDGSINADVSLANSPNQTPLPIGRQVLQLTGYDEQGNLTVIDTVITIGQGVPAPERLRETDLIPDLQPGQTLATSAGQPESVTITSNTETRQISIQSTEWSLTVTVPEENGMVDETAPGALTIQFIQGGTAVVDGQGFQPDTRVDIFLFSDPTLLGSFTVSEDGFVSAEIYLDKRFATVGDHTLQIQGVGNDGYVKAANLGVLVEQPVEVTTESASGLLWWVAGAFLLLLLVVLFIIVARRRRA